MPLTSRDSLSRLAIQQIAGSAGSTRYLGRESRPPKTDFEDLSRPENFLIVRIVSLCVGVRPRHNSDWRGGIVPSIELLDEIPGVGFFTAATLIAEIGDFSLFNSPKALTAFFGLDPSVNQSGKFNGDRNKISKRGTRIGRRILFTVAMASIRRTRDGKEINPVLRDFYATKCVSKKKKVALVAVMHKLLHYIFAVLRDQKTFEFRKPEDHQSWRNSKLQPVAA